MKSPKLKEKAWEILKSVLCYKIKQNIVRTEAIDTIVIIFFEKIWKPTLTLTLIARENVYCSKIFC